MEEPMSLSTEDAVEGFVEGRERVEESSACFEVETETTSEIGEGVADKTSQPSSDSALSDLRTLKGILEALLFVTADPIPVTRFSALLGTVTKQELEQALISLSYDYEQEGRGLQLIEVAGGYRIVTKAEFAPWLKRLEKVKAPAKLSRSALESLAIIAYKQPIVRAEVEQIRGVETSGVIRTLLERKLVRIVGRKEEPGRPIMYGTTKFFLEHFGLRDLSQLPPLREFKELGEAEQAMLPMDESVEIRGESSAQHCMAFAEPVAGEGFADATCVDANGAVMAMRTGDVVEDDAESELMVIEVVDES